MRKVFVQFWLLTDEIDIPRIVSLTRQAHQASRFRQIPFSAEKTAKIAKRTLSDEGRSAVMLAGGDGELLGAAYCGIGEYIIGEDVLFTTIHGVFVADRIRKTLGGGRVAIGLLKGIETWSSSRSAVGVWMHANFGIDDHRTKKLMQRVGYLSTGTSYFKSMT